MGYSVHYGITNCWKCGPHSLFSVLKELLPEPPGKLKRILQQIRKDKEPEHITEKAVKNRRLVLPFGIGDLLKPHREYLRKRGFIPKELQRLWGIQGIGQEGKLSWRIFIPISEEGQTVSWTTRSISSKPNIIRYISASKEQEIISHKNLLYGQDKAQNTIIICEGPFDVWRIGYGAVCTFGIRVRPAQIFRMSKHPTRIICFDSEPAAQQEARKLADALGVFPGDTYVCTLDAKDPAGASEKEIRKLRRRFLENG